MQVTQKLEEVRKTRLKPEVAKLHNIVDMALSFSAMMRLFKENSKDIIMDKISNDETRSLKNLYIRKRKADILVANKNAAAKFRNDALITGGVIAGLLGLGKIGVTAMRERLIK